MLFTSVKFPPAQSSVVIFKQSWVLMAKLEREMLLERTNLLPVPGITPEVHTNTDLMLVMIYRSMAWSLARVLCEVESFSVLLLLETH